MNNILERDFERYENKKDMPLFQVYYRKVQSSRGIKKRIYNFFFKIAKRCKHIELHEKVEINEGLYFGHPINITINPQTIIGKNCNIHKGVTLGQENRGVRKGAPTIGDEVWIGINSTIVGNVAIGNDVLIAPNTYINRDIPDHSVVFGNPCIIKHKSKATEDYINRKV